MTHNAIFPHSEIFDSQLEIFNTISDFESKMQYLSHSPHITDKILEHYSIVATTITLRSTGYAIQTENLCNQYVQFILQNLYKWLHKDVLEITIYGKNLHFGLYSIYAQVSHNK